MKLIPIVALVSESRLPELHAAADRYRTNTPADVLASMDAIAERNGWTDEAIVAGVLIDAALNPNPQENPQ